MQNENNNQLALSRKVVIRDINALLQTAPISRIKTLRDDEGRSKGVGQVLPDNRKYLIENNSCVEGPDEQHLRTSGSLNNTPSSGPTGHLPPHGEAAYFNTPSTLRERVECVSTGVRGIFKEETLNKNDFRAPLRSGFTLIELLVVILIIGILAAVALPQYQLAVRKARFTRLRGTVESAVKAVHLYFLTNNTWPTSLVDLDFSLKGTSEKNNCQIFDDMYCCIQFPRFNYSGMIACGTKDQSFQYKHIYATVEEEGGFPVLKNQFSCFEKDGVNLCEKLPGSRNHNPAAYTHTPDGIIQGHYYEID